MLIILSIFSMFSNSVFSKELNVIFLITSSYPVLGVGFLILTSRLQELADCVTLAPAAPALPGVPVTHAGWKRAPPLYEQLREAQWRGGPGQPSAGQPLPGHTSCFVRRAGGDLEGGDQGEPCQQTLSHEPSRGAGQWRG